MHTRTQILSHCVSLMAITNTTRARYYGIKGLKKDTVIVTGFSAPRKPIWTMIFYFKNGDLTICLNGKRYQHHPDAELPFTNTG